LAVRSDTHDRLHSIRNTFYREHILCISEDDMIGWVEASVTELLNAKEPLVLEYPVLKHTMAGGSIDKPGALEIARYT
jgi:hypothetical protein